jgi:hypothetical protein
MSIAEVRSDVAKLASQISFNFVEVPRNLALMPTLDAIHARLQEDVATFGGYALLAKALPSVSAKVWQGKIERTGRFGLFDKDFIQLINLFQDRVLVSLVAQERSGDFLDLSSIPESDFSPADLQWALINLSAEGMLECCELREKRLDGEDCSESQARLGQLSQQAIVLVRQMELVLKSRSRDKSQVHG